MEQEDNEQKPGFEFIFQTRCSRAAKQNNFMRKFLLIFLICSFPSGPVLLAQANPQVSNPPASNPPDKSSATYSGMYSFLRDGEFVQITVEDGGRVTGFISRYGDLESDKDAFLDHFFKEGKLDGNKLSFSTETVHGVWFAFVGTVNRGTGKQPGDEAYYVLNGSLTEHMTDTEKKTSSRSREVALKSFPQDMAPSPQHKE